MAGIVPSPDLDLPALVDHDLLDGTGRDDELSTDDVVEVPYDWAPREYQTPLWSAFMQEGRDRGCIVWHRRAGKDATCWNLLISKAVERVGLYFYCFPTFTQGRKIIWKGMTREGRRYLDMIPAPLVQSINNTEMTIELVNGSIIQLVGVENIDNLVGSNPVGCLFSEYSLQNPMAWELLRPILAENGGWALFVYTPRGRNHGWALYNAARRNPKRWFAQVLTVDNTKRPDGTPVVTPEAIQDERDAGMAEDLIQQEFYCSFDAAIQGAYYSAQLRAAWNDGRVRSIPFEPNLPTFSSWDLGMDDATGIWVFQAHGTEIRMLRYLENTGKGLSWYINALRELRDAQGFQWERHFGPHDLKVRELGTGVSRLKAALDLGLRFKIVPKLTINDGIDAVRRIFSRLYFDEEGCGRGLSALADYTKEWDEDAKIFRDRPKHDWTSHAADALRYGALGWRDRYAVPVGERGAGSGPIIAKTMLD